MRVLVALLLSCLIAPAAIAQEDEWVDLELVLMVDVSRSMSPRELEIQRIGYIEALRSDEVLEAIQSGYQGRIAITYVEWAGSQDVIVPWRAVATREDLDAFAQALTVRSGPGFRRTSISEALIFGAALFEGNGYMGDRRVIDISGDGPNNQGRGVEVARDAVVAQGIQINGLPLMTREGMGSQYQLDQLDVYYETCVIGGLGSFVMPVNDWDDFPEAIQRKMVLEIMLGGVERPLRPIPIQALSPDPRDCFIGEKMWAARMDGWGTMP